MKKQTKKLSLNKITVSQFNAYTLPGGKGVEYRADGAGFNLLTHASACRPCSSYFEEEAPTSC
jgi:hypothetical protein